MAKKQQSAQLAKPHPPVASSPVTAAVAATLPLVYSAQIAHAQTRSGPLPPPELLRQYEDLKLGLADRIVTMAEAEAEHRRKMEVEVIAVQARDQQAYRRSELLGQVFGLMIGFAAIAGAIVCALHGAQIAAAFIGTSGVTGLVTAFIMGRNLLMKQREQELQQQQKIASQRMAELKALESGSTNEHSSEEGTE